jgi:hypothetical protein
MEYSLEACEMMREMNFGVGLGAFMLDAAARDGIFGPVTWDYPSWQKRIKGALDPEGMGDARFYCAE